MTEWRNTGSTKIREEGEDHESTLWDGLFQDGTINKC